ncbi:MAG: hypothetical protein ACLGQX_16735 [Acidobacteriota bacterium]|jgi:hypothetical protein
MRFGVFIRSVRASKYSGFAILEPLERLMQLAPSVAASERDLEFRAGLVPKIQRLVLTPLRIQIHLQGH